MKHRDDFYNYTIPSFMTKYYLNTQMSQCTLKSKKNKKNVCKKKKKETGYVYTGIYHTKMHRGINIYPNLDLQIRTRIYKYTVLTA